MGSMVLERVKGYGRGGDYRIESEMLLWEEESQKQPDNVMGEERKSSGPVQLFRVRGNLG